MRAMTVSLRSLTQRPLRTAFTVCAVAISIAGLVSMAGLSRGVQDSLSAGIEESGGDLVVTQRDAFTLTGSAVPEEIVVRLRSIPGVRAVTGVLFGLLTADDRMNIPVVGWSADNPGWNTLKLSAGALPPAEASGNVVLGEAAARALDKQAGSELLLHFRKFRVAGVARFDSVFGQNMAVVPLADLQGLLHRDKSVTLLQIELERPLANRQVEEMTARIAAAAPEFSVQPTSELGRSLRLIHVINALAGALSLVVLLLAVLGVANTLMMAFNERTHEIAILSAIGWPARRIVALVLGEALIMSSAGAALGILLGFLVMAVAARTHVAAGYLQFYTDISILVQAVLAALAIGVLGAAYPALRAVRLQPAEALKQT